MVKYDNQFLSLYKLLAHVSQSQYNQQQAQAFIQQNINKGLLSDLYNAKYLISDNYRTWVMVNEWPTYLSRLNRLKDNLEKQHKPDLLTTVAKHYPAGKVKDYTMNSLMQGAIEFAKTVAKLNEYKIQFAPYIDSLSNNVYKTAIATSFDNKLADLLRTQTGQPAPPFSLQSSENKTHSLGDFKGKVVYIDLWASWCKPCRAETPAFKLLYNKYKADNRIAFISIAVQDGAAQWRKALAEDQPDWLQLIDKNNAVWTSYVANTIPKFIIVDKQGNLANFDAPRPSDGKALEDLLETEMAK